MNPAIKKIVIIGLPILAIDYFVDMNYLIRHCVILERYIMKVKIGVWLRAVNILLVVQIVMGMKMLWSVWMSAYKTVLYHDN